MNCEILFNILLEGIPSSYYVSGSRGGQTIPCFRPMGLQSRSMQEASQ